MRRHKKLRFTLHFSGTLLESLHSMDSPTLRAVKDGVADGQFELLGSTYAQNVMAASDPFSNRLQMEQHLETLWKFFRVKPKGFWISERCWKQEFVKIVREFGYEYTLVEQQTLAKSGTNDVHVPHVTAVKDRQLTIINDDEPFKQLVNLAVWASDRATYFDMPSRHLDELGRTYKKQDAIAVYAEDAEAAGLWGYHHGAYPQPLWRNWARLLDHISQNTPHKITSVRDFLSRVKKRIAVAKIPDGQAQWMVASLSKRGAPYHEDGYKDWFDFCASSPKLIKFRKLFSQTARAITAMRKKSAHTSFTDAAEFYPA